MTRNIPKIEDLHAPFAEITQRQQELQDKSTKLRAEAAELRLRIAARLTTRDNARIDALIDGRPVPDQGADDKRLNEVLGELRDIDDAAFAITERVRRERTAGSKKVTATLAGEHRTLLSRLWAGLAAAATARLEIQDLHRDLRMAGVELTEVAAGGDAAFPGFLKRSDRLAVEMRKAASDGLIPSHLVPEALR